LSLTKVYIASSRMAEIGDMCTEYAALHMPEGYEICHDMHMCDIFISVLYDTIISDKFIKSKKLCVNFHPGILPEYRGAGAYSWAIINKEKEAGVTLHEIDYNIDSGPIISIEKTLIHPTDTSETLFLRCMNVLYDMFCKNFHKILFKQYSTSSNSGGNIYLRKDLDNAKDISHIIRGLTFSGKESAYFYDHEDKKVYIDYFGD